MTDQSTEKSITIIGTGALACLFAARLSRVARVRLIGSWQNQIDAINTRGITVHELDGSTQTVLVPAILHSPQLPTGPADYVIVLVKSYQTTAAVERITHCSNGDTLILTLQNGLGNIEQLSVGLADRFVSAGVTMQGANIHSPGTVIHAGNGTSIIDAHPQLHALLELFNQAQLPTLTAHQSGALSINEVLWRKLIINTAINPLTALLGERNGFVAQNAAARALSEATAIESANIAMLDGAWPDSDPASAATLSCEAATVTATNRSSMLQDVSRGNRTEIGAMCGQVVQRAQSHNSSAPLNQLWLELIQKAENIDAGSGGRPLYTPAELTRLAGFK